MPAYARVQIANFFLTSTGDETGTPCKVIASGTESLQSSLISETVRAIDGTKHTSSAALACPDARIGFTFNIKAADMDDLLVILNNAVNTGVDLAIIVTDYPSFSVTASPVYQNHALYTKRSRSRLFLYDVNIQFDVGSVVSLG